MRDSENMRSFLEELEDLWKRYPDKRFGQLIAGISGSEQRLLRMEDDELRKVIRGLSGDIMPDASLMSTPGVRKYKTYEQYFLEHGAFVHAVVVDEKGLIRRGYVSWLLSVRYGVPVDIMQVDSSEPVEKHVSGRHVVWRPEEKKYEYRNQKSYEWNYGIRDAVVPGDVLQVNTRRGKRYMVVERIFYVTGKEDCGKVKQVKKHMRHSVLLQKNEEDELEIPAD